ncbi:unnamed protein product [Prorocentrum cordatum]|uniref:Uncharacterized protein n=1 Tax=Prorocentrum cordatum TaxID=2364126 RepID=A0ABN9TV33_9DINO|nr:unnamed protein product [Polarella glacialis]
MAARGRSWRRESAAATRQSAAQEDAPPPPPSPPPRQERVSVEGRLGRKVWRWWWCIYPWDPQRSSSARPQAVQVGCLVLFVGGVAAALGGELRGRPRLADGAPGASDAEHAALRRVVEESKMQARAGMRAHLQEFLGGHPQARYEEWIADFHPDNVVPPGRDSRGLPSIDRRHYHERSDHRMIWNEHVGDQRRHVSQFSLWLAEEAERAAARAELGWAWPADDEPAPEAEMEALDDVDSTKQLILAGGLPVSVFNQWAQLERMRLVLDAGARRLCIRGSEDRAHQDDGESEESWDVGKMRSRTKGRKSA